MQIKTSIVFLAVTIASSALADARFATSSQQFSNPNSLVYAQLQIGDLSQSDLRRLIFYADRATGTLYDLIEGADGREISDQDKVNKRFRESIARMADAGARTGLSMDQVADFYTKNVFDTYGEGFMQKTRGFAGGLEFRTLFRNVSALSNRAESIGDDELLGALAQASEGLQLETRSAETAPVVEVTTAIDGPVALPDANAIEISIIKRIQVVDGRWELTITSGDSLSSIASAIYGDALSYTTIQSANAGVIRNPNVIEVGTLLVLPKP